MMSLSIYQELVHIGKKKKNRDVTASLLVVVGLLLTLCYDICCCIPTFETICEILRALLSAKNLIDSFEFLFPKENSSLKYFIRRIQSAS